MKKYTKNQILDLFDKAITLDSLIPPAGSPDEEIAATKAGDAAFNAAAKSGWNWEDDLQFCTWALKATQDEIFVEGRKRFSESTAS